MKYSELEKLIDYHSNNCDWSNAHEKAIKETVKVFFENFAGASYGEMQHAVNDFELVAFRVLKSCQFTLEADE